MFLKQGDNLSGPQQKKWVLNGATVLYGSASELSATLDYDFSEEKKFSYKNLSMGEIIHHLAVFVSRLWQIHVFEEGNTRTTAVFFIKYLRTLGFDVNNDIFAENAWYFRNALVRTNYNDLKNCVHETTEFLELFLRNLLLEEAHPLHNRALHISGTFKSEEKVNIERRSRMMRLDGFGLFVEDMGKMIRFYRDVLGFEIKEEENTSNVYLVKDGTLFLLYGRNDFEKMTNRKYEYVKGLNGHFEMALYVNTFEEVDEAYKKAVENGAVPVLAPELEPWGQRTCYIADPEGNLIEIGSWNKPYEEKDL